MPLVDVNGKAGAVLFWHSGHYLRKRWCYLRSDHNTHGKWQSTLTGSWCECISSSTCNCSIIVAGDHVPVMPLVDVNGKAGAVLF
jgi:hypothetical protein